MFTMLGFKAYARCSWLAKFRQIWALFELLIASSFEVTFWAVWEMLKLLKMYCFYGQKCWLKVSPLMPLFGLDLGPFWPLELVLI